MFQVIVILGMIAAVLLMMIILVQNPKGGGLTGTFGGTANQFLGYKTSTDSVEKGTWYLFVFIIVVCLSSTAFKPKAATPANAAPQGAKPPSAAQAPDQATQPGNDEGVNIGGDQGDNGDDNGGDNTP